MRYCFGIDIGGTTVKMGLFEESGKLLDKWTIQTVTENQGEAILPDIAKSVSEKREEYGIAADEVIGLGVGVPAAVCEGRYVEDTTNLGWGYKEVKRELEEMTGFAVKVENDANLAALGEMWKGVGREYKDAVMVTLGTGVGGGIIIDGKILSGVKGGAGEIGEIIVDYEMQEDGKRVPRNLEYYASATGIKRLTGNQYSAKQVFEQAKMGDQKAIAVLERFGFYLGTSLTNLAVTLAPEAFIIGGGVSKAGDLLLHYVNKYYHAGDTKVVLASLGNDAGIYGAAKLILK